VRVPGSVVVLRASAVPGVVVSHAPIVERGRGRGVAAQPVTNPRNSPVAGP
jgi:hypothetical protein